MINPVHDSVLTYCEYRLILDMASIYLGAFRFRIFVQTENELAKEDEWFLRSSLISRHTLLCGHTLLFPQYSALGDD